MSQVFTSGGQSIGASASVLPVNIQGWFPLGLTGLISQETLKSLLQHHSSKVSVHGCSAFFMVQLSHPYMTTEKTIALTRWIFFGKVMSLLFNMLSRFVIVFLPKEQVSLFLFHDYSHHLQWFWNQRKCHCCHFFPIYLLWRDGTGCHDLRFLNVEF